MKRTLISSSILSIAIATYSSSSLVFAQGSSGYIYGNAGSQNTVVIRNVDTNQIRTQQTGDDGRYLVNLPPANYEV